MTVCHIYFATLMLLNLVQVILFTLLEKTYILLRDFQVIHLFVSFECRAKCVFVGVGEKESGGGGGQCVVSSLVQEIVPRNEI